MSITADSPEIVAAAKWWTDILREAPKMDNGDGMQSVMGTVAVSGNPPLTESVLDAFRLSLARRLVARYASSWKPENPNWGSATRTVGVDYGPCSDLQDAAADAGIDRIGLRFPWKTNMWVDPGCVRVSEGYRSPIEIVWQADPPPPAVRSRGKTKADRP